MATNGKKPEKGAAAFSAASIRDLITQSKAPAAVPQSAADIRALIQQQPAAQPVLQANDPLVPFTQPEQVTTVATSQEFPQVPPSVTPKLVHRPDVAPLISLPEGMTQEQFQQSLAEQDQGVSQEILAEQRASAKDIGRDFESLTVGEQQALVPDPTIRRNIIEFFTGKRRETEETRTLPRLGQLNLSLGTDLKRAAAVLTASSPEERVQMIKEIVPGATFRFDTKGNIIGKFPDGREGVLNPPGFDTTDALKIATEMAKFTPATRAAGGLAAGLGTGLGGRIATQAGGAALTATASEIGSAALGGEFQPSEVAIETALAGVGEGIGEGVSALRRRRALRPGTEAAESADLIAAGQEAGAETGIDLFKAQETLVPSQLERQSFVSQLPAGAQTSIKALRTQNEQAADAVTDFLNSIAPSDVVENAATKFRTASERAVEAQKTIRSERASPLYNQAFRENPPVNLTPVRDSISERFEAFPDGGEVQRSLSRISKFLSGKKVSDPGSPILDAKGNIVLPPSTTITQPNLQKLHNAKVEIDQMIAKVGEGSLGNTTKRQLIEVQGLLLEQIDTASDAYKEARRVFTAESPAVAQLSEGIIGRISKLDDPNLKNISKTVFDSAETNPQVISRIRATIERQDPQAWNDLLRVEMQRRMLTAKPDILESATETVENIPGQLIRALGLNQQGKLQVLRNSLNPNQRKNLSFLVTALKRAQLGRATGSQTAARGEIKEELRGGIANAIGAFLQPSKTASDAFRNSTFDRRTKAMAEAFFDPQWTERVAEIRKQKIGSVSASRAMTQLLNEIETESLSTTEQPQEQ